MFKASRKTLNRISSNKSIFAVSLFLKLIFLASCQFGPGLSPLDDVSPSGQLLERPSTFSPNFNSEQVKSLCQKTSNECQPYYDALCAVATLSNQGLAQGAAFINPTVDGSSIKGKSCFSSRDDYAEQLPEHVKRVFNFILHSGDEVEELQPSFGSPQFGDYLNPKLMHYDLVNGDSYSFAGHCEDKESCGYEKVERCIRTDDGLDWICFIEEHKVVNGEMQFEINVDPTVKGKSCSSCHGGHNKSRHLIGEYGKWDGWYGGLGGIDHIDQLISHSSVREKLGIQNLDLLRFPAGSEVKEQLDAVPNLSEQDAFKSYLCRHGIIDDCSESFLPEEIESTAYDHIIFKDALTNSNVETSKEFRIDINYGKANTVATGFFALQHAQTLYNRILNGIRFFSLEKKNLAQELIIYSDPNINCETETDLLSSVDIQNLLMDEFNLNSDKPLFEAVMNLVGVEALDFYIGKEYKTTNMTSAEAFDYNAGSDSMKSLVAVKNLLYYAENSNTDFQDFLTQEFLNPQIRQSNLFSLTRDTLEYSANEYGIANLELDAVQNGITAPESWANFYNKYSFSELTVDSANELFELQPLYLIKVVTPGVHYTIYEPYMKPSFYLANGGSEMYQGLNQKRRFCEVLKSSIIERSPTFSQR